MVELFFIFTSFFFFFFSPNLGQHFPGINYIPVLFCHSDLGYQYFIFLPLPLSPPKMITFFLVFTHFLFFLSFFFL